MSLWIFKERPRASLCKHELVLSNKVKRTDLAWEIWEEAWETEKQRCEGRFVCVCRGGEELEDSTHREREWVRNFGW